MELNSDSVKPLYLQLTEYLKRQIQTGNYTAGQKLPSERELAQKYRVSRMTARQAIQQLVQDGLAYAQVGKGTFVRPAKIHQELRELTSFTQEMTRRNAVASSVVLEKKFAGAIGETATYLQLPEGSEVFVLRRVRLADGECLALQTSHLNAVYCPGIASGYDFEYLSLYSVLREVYNLHLVWANQWIEARLPTAFEREHLKIGKYSPVLSLTRVTYNSGDKPVEYVRSVYIGEHYQLQTTLRVNSGEG